MPFYFYLVTIAASVVGFTIAFYIHQHKKAPTLMVCPLDADCETVITSHYSKFLQVPLEQWGMLYYGLVAGVYASFIAWPAASNEALSLGIALLSIFAFLFSLYLTYIQIAKLRELCTWCLISALCSATIFLALLGNSFAAI